MIDTSPADSTRDQRRLLLDQVEGRLKVQSDEMDGLDRKATTVLAATGVILGLVVNNADHFVASPNPTASVFFGSLVVLVVGLGAGVRALWPRPFSVVPEPAPLLAAHANKSPEETMGELATTKAEAFRRNVAVTMTKANRIRAQMVLLTLGGGLLVGAYVVERIV